MLYHVLEVKVSIAHWGFCSVGEHPYVVNAAASCELLQHSTVQTRLQRRVSCPSSAQMQRVPLQMHCCTPFLKTNPGRE